MIETVSSKPIIIREDYVFAAEQCALMAEKIAKDEDFDMDDLKKKINDWRKLRKKLIHEK